MSAPRNFARVVWPQDINRPLSEEEQEIALRLDLAEEILRDGFGEEDGLGEACTGLADYLQAKRLEVGIKDRRRGDVGECPKRAWLDAIGGFSQERRAA